MRTLKLAFSGLLTVALLIASSAAYAAKRAKAARAGGSTLQAGMAAIDQGNFNSAINILTQVVKKKKTSSVYFMLGWAHYQRGFKTNNPERADKNDARAVVKAYSAVLKIEPDLGSLSEPYRLYHSLALAYECLNDYDKAIDSYKKSFIAAPNNPMLPLYAARLRHEMGDNEKSTANLALALKRAKQTNRETIIIDLLNTDPMFAGLLNDPQNKRLIEENGFNASPKEESSQQTAEQGSQDETQDQQNSEIAAQDEPALKDALHDQTTRKTALAPAENEAVTSSLASAEERFKYRKYQDAIDAYSETLALDASASSLAPMQLALIYEHMGTSYNKLGISKEAIHTLQRSLQQKPDNPMAHYQIALAYSLSGKYSQSMRALQAAVECAPSPEARRKVLLLAKTDPELDPIRDMPQYRELISNHK